jgi:hypothetical protein
MVGQRCCEIFADKFRQLHDVASLINSPIDTIVVDLPFLNPSPPPGSYRTSSGNTIQQSGSSLVESLIQLGFMLLVNTFPTGSPTKPHLGPSYSSRS